MGSTPITRLLFRLGYAQQMDAILRKVRPDVIHAHYLTNAAFLLPYARRHRIPLVVTVHGYDATRRLKLFSSYDRILAMRRRAISRHAAAILPVSNYLCDIVRQHGLTGSNVCTHYLGIPLPDTPLVDVNANPQRIVFAGRLVEKKGIDRVIEAFGLIRDRFPMAELHVVGGGPLTPMVEAARDRIGGIVAYGAQPHASLVEIMRSGQIFTMPSREAANGDSEGLGLTLIEAQAAGLPVVTSKQTGTRETCVDGQTGLLVEPNDVRGLAEAFATLLADSGRRALMGRAARLWVEQRFDITRQTAALEILYDKLVG
nr:glycosyltransferase [Novosphingobium fluoreni]